jgi:uncharacterized membrane protein
MESLESALYFGASLLKLTLEGISLLCVFTGLVTTVRNYFRQKRSTRIASASLESVRLTFGRWLSVALEFQLGADIVNTTVAPSLEALARLGAIAVIRTFLNFFLTRELAQETGTTSTDQESAPT